MFLGGRERHTQMRILFITLSMQGSGGVNNVLWWGAVDSGGGGGWLLAAILRPTAAVNALVTHQLLFLKFPSQREGHGIHGGATSEHAWRSRLGQFQGLTLVAIKIPCSDLLLNRTWLTDSLSCCSLSAGPFLKEMGYFCSRLSINSVDIFSELGYYQRLLFFFF